MRLAKELMTSGVLGRGEVRHCTDWDVAAARRPSSLGRSPVFRQAEARRRRAAAQFSKQSWIRATFRWLAKGPHE
jgi:hypothetical protein